MDSSSTEHEGSADGPDQGDPAALGAEVQRLRTELDDLRANPRDDHHTMTELYDYRLLYNAHAARGWLAQGIPVVRSWKHSDGEPCFGGGWFIVTATLPTGQVSNHYREDAWDLFAGVPEVDLPPEYDGHTPAVAADRLRDANRAPGAAAAAPPGGEVSDRVRDGVCLDCGGAVLPSGEHLDLDRHLAALAAPPAGHEDEAAVERAVRDLCAVRYFDGTAEGRGANMALDSILVALDVLAAARGPRTPDPGAGA